MYIEFPDYIDNAKTSVSVAGSGGYLAPEGTKNGIGVFSNFFASVLLATTLGAGGAATVNNWQPTADNTIAHKIEGVRRSSIVIPDEDDLTKPALLSAKLQSAFGFKTAQWAAILGVERKTIYNWEKEPETRVQARVSERLKVMNSFLHEIDTEHAKYLSKFAFGRYADSKFADLLKSNPLVLEELVKIYDHLYADIDGQYKRDKHTIA